jgi:acetylornithine deacetylase/succinyl-diaminopimelate desuccinylase family protein
MTTLQAMESSMIDLTRQLIAIPTSNPPGEKYQACMQLMAQILQQMSIPFQIISIPERDTETSSYPRYALIARYGEGEKTLHFHGHYDVVPAYSPEQFQPYISKGSLFGRGASDMKSGLAAMIFALHALKEGNIPLHGNICLSIVPDEETGGRLGTQYLFAQGYLTSGGMGMLTPEPTSGVIWHANRGAFSLRITIKGKAAHVGLQYKGINAFEGMLTVANALLALKREVVQRKTRYRVQPAAAASSILLLGGQCAGGVNFNVVPDSCSFTLDRRINPEEDLETEKEAIWAILERCRQQGIEIETEVLQEGESSYNPAEGSIANALVRSVEEVYKATPPFELCPGLLEIRFFTKHGTPSYAFSHGILSVSHGPNEFIRVEDIKRCAMVYALTAQRVLGA